jgi:GTPase SAR1 family protein
MGACGSTPKANSTEEAQADKMITEAARADQNQENKVSKLLLLGAGASGKSTLFKQMISIYGKGFPDSERKTYTSIIHNNVLGAMRILLKHCDRFGTLPASLAESRRILEADMKEDQPVTEELAAHIKQLWHCEALQATFQHQNEFQLTDSAKYFFDRIDEISKFDYIPTEQDVLRSRAPTTGISKLTNIGIFSSAIAHLTDMFVVFYSPFSYSVENSFVINGHNFKMFDVGGQRNERKKWIHCFENVTAVLFVAAISEYNQVLYEDETQNRMVESLQLFDEICNSKWFRKTSLILFLNKRDLFAEKIPLFPLANYFREYSGPNDYDNCLEWIKQQFESKNQEQDKTIYTHVTCATDRNNIQAIFSAVCDIIVKKTLARAGLS